MPTDTSTESDLDRIASQSVTYRVWKSIHLRLDAAVGDSRLNAVPSRLSRLVQASWLYRWLTKEPEPDVIVIDLRDTITVGPVVKFLDWVITIVTPWVRESAVRSLSRSLVRTSRAVPVKAAAIVLLIAILIRWSVSLFQGELGGFELAIGLIGIVVAGIGLRVDYSWAELRDTELASRIIGLLAPPEPPDETQPTEHPKDDRD